MRFFLLSLLFVTLLFGFDLKKELNEAKKEGKIAAFLVVKTGCPWCHKMMQLIEKDKEVSSVLKSKFRLVILNKDDVELPEILSTKFYPTIHFLDENGDVIYQIIGFNEKNVLLSELSYIKVQK